MNDDSLREALVRRLHERAIVSGSIVLPAVPSMLEDYVAICDRVFKGVGVTFTDEQLDNLRDVIKGQLDAAFTASPRSDIVITYDSPAGLVVNYHVKAQWASVDSAYDTWVNTREPPLFGTEPDARVWDLAVEADDPAKSPVLDLGAGTGRNAIALARRGHPVDAVEVTAGFAEELRAAAIEHGLPVRVLQRDMFDRSDDLRDDYGLIIMSEVTSDFRSTDQLRQALELATHHLSPQGRLVMNAFLPRDDYVPDDAARELAQQCYSSLFTRGEIDTAMAGLPLTLESDLSVYDYESTRQPTTGWPPTSWYERWIHGQDVFPIDRAASPIEFRWLVFTKRA